MADETGVILNKGDRVGVEVPNTSPTESRVLIGAPDFRVFIFGVEVSSDVFSVSVSHSYNERIGTARINMVNDNEKWILPTSIAAVSQGLRADELSIGGIGPQNFSIFTEDRMGTNTKADNEVADGVFSEGDRRGVMTPRRFAQRKQENMKKRLDQLEIPALREAIQIRFRDQSSFPFIPGAPLIQMADPIRIFFKNPWNLKTRITDESFETEEQWYFAFTGFIASVTEDFDAETNKSILRIFCEDIRRILRYARVTSNPQVFDFLSIPRSFRSGGGQDRAGIIQRDLARYTANNAIQAGQTLVDLKDNTTGIMENMLFNTTPGGQPRNESDGTVPQGVLGFRRPDNLSETIFEVNASEVERRTSPFLTVAYPELTRAQVDTFGEDWSLGALDKMNRLYIIVPLRANFPNRPFPYDLRARVNFYYEFKSRFDVINEFVKVQDSIWYTTPKGDIVLEFPQYDATPFKYDLPWSSVLTIQDEFSGFNMTEDDRKIQTQTIATTSPVEAFDLNTQSPILGHGSKENPELIARYGIRLHMEGRPFKYSQRDTESANALAAMWQELTNADAYRLEGLSTLPNFRAPIARPFYFKARNMMAFATQISHTIVWGELARTEYGFQYLRHFDPVSGKWLRVGGNYGWNWSGDSIASGEIAPQDEIGAGVTPLQSELRGASDAPQDNQTVQALEEALRNIESNEQALGIKLLNDADRQTINSSLTMLKDGNGTTEFRASMIDHISNVLTSAEGSVEKTK